MQFKKFSIIFLLSFCMLALLLLVILGILRQHYEHNSYENIVKKQIQNNAIYGSALNENYFLYRLELIKQKKPKIVALGSSRAGQFRQKFFNAPFVAATNGANSLAEMSYFIDEMLKQHHPTLVILTLDPWWFNPKYPNHRIMPYQNINGLNISFDKVFNSLILIPKVLFSEHPSPQTIFQTMGIRANLTSNGSFQDGSIFYATNLASKTTSLKDFEPENNSGRFVMSNSIDQARIKQFEAILQKLRKNKISYILLIPPLAPHTMQILNKQEGYKYFNDLTAYIKDCQGFSFLDTGLLKTNDSEFYDAIHPGDIVYAKMLYTIKDNKKLCNFLNIENLLLTIKKNNQVYSDNFFLTKSKIKNPKN